MPKSTNSKHVLLSSKPHFLEHTPTVVEKQIKNIFSGKETLIAFRDGQDELTQKKTKWQFGKNTKNLKQTQTDTLKNELISYCLTHMQDTYRIHLSRLQGLEILERLVQSDIELINQELAVHMVWASLSCVHHFLLRIKSESGMLSWMKRRQAKKSVRVFEKVLLFLTGKHYITVLNAIITFYEEANLWEIEYFCSNLLERLFILASDRDQIDSVHEILSLVENSTMTNVQTSRDILIVLFRIEESLNWTLMSRKLVDRILEMYYKSVTPEALHEYNYNNLEKGLETCIRAMSLHFGTKQLMFMIEWMLQVAEMERMSEESLLQFGSILQYITSLYTRRAYKRSLPDQVFPHIIKLISSKKAVYTLLGNRVLHELMDRGNNKRKLDTPTLFMKDTNYDILIHQYVAQDKMLFQRYRELIHKTFVSVVITHGKEKIHLENIYRSIVLFLVEIPCSYTAASAVCLAMSIQEAAFDNRNMDINHAHRLHATVVSIMSLVCYVHNATNFYEYVYSIIEKRANFAPHLNPPLRNKYTYARHHILWNKPELFFEDWEARYGLWKCFKNTQKGVVVVKV